MQFDPNRRQFFEKTGKGALGLALVTATGVSLAGCPAGGILSAIETWVPLGLSAFDTIVTLINPVAGSAISIVVSTVNNLWNAVTVAISNYQHTTDPTKTLLDKVIASLDALSGGLGQILGSLPVGLSAAVAAMIKGGVSLLIATLKSIQAKIEGTPVPTPAALKVQYGSVAASNPKEFIEKFNNILVANGHPARLK